MLELLGLTDEADAVYRAMLVRPSWTIDEIAIQSGFAQVTVRAAVARLRDLALVRPAWYDPQRLLPTPPRTGLAALLARVEARADRQKQQLAAVRATISAIAAEYDAECERDSVLRLTGLDAAHLRLQELAATASSDCRLLARSGPDASDAFELSRRFAESVAGRGLPVRVVLPDRVRTDGAVLTHAAWLAARGGTVRTAPVVPVLLAVLDQEVAVMLGEVHPGATHGAQLRDPVAVTGLCALFDQVWTGAKPLSEPSRPDRRGLLSTEQELIRMLAAGVTDEVAARRLGVSVRTVRRMMADLMSRLGARSRFQAGVRALGAGWVGGPDSA